MPFETVNVLDEASNPGVREARVSFFWISGKGGANRTSSAHLVAMVLARWLRGFSVRNLVTNYHAQWTAMFCSGLIFGSSLGNYPYWGLRVGPFPMARQ